MPKPRALFIAPALPGRNGNGLAMRLGMFLEGLARVAETELLILPIAGSASEGADLANELAVPVTSVGVAGRADTQYVLLSMIRDPNSRLNAFKAYGRGSRHSFVSLQVQQEIQQFAAARSPFDIVHVARLYVSDAASAVPARVKTLDLDEDDAWSWRLESKAAQLSGDEIRAAWAIAEAEAEDRLLGRVAPSFDRLFISGPADAARRPELALEVIANGVEFVPQPRREDDGSTLLFIGGFGYGPNVEGILWFVSEVWGRVREGLPAARLLIAGRNMPENVHALGGTPGIEILGAVEDVETPYAQATLAIAPLHLGGGTRIKLIEAASFGVPIVSTSLAAQGLDFGPEAIWTADDAPAFAQAILAALGDEPERKRRAALARASALQTYDRRKIVGEISARFERLLTQTAGTL